MLKTRIAQVLERLDKGETAEAVGLCTLLLQEFPREAAVHQLAAAAALQKGRPFDALAAAKKALELRPRHGPTLMLAGKAARAAGDTALARSLLAEAARLMPERAEPQFLHYAVLLEGGSPDVAGILERLCQNFPGNTVEWQEIIDILYRAGQFEQALHVLARITDRAPDPGLVAKRAIILRQCGRMTEARTVLEQAIRLNPKSARAWFLLGLTLQDEQMPAEAAEAFAKAQRAEPDFAEAAVNEGIAWQEAGDLDAARRAYGNAVRLRLDTFGRIAQAITAAPKGELWLDLRAFRLSLAR
jgi:tetratricopeptide (TPR) repeat protein